MSLCWEALWGVSNSLILQIFQKDNGKINLSGLTVTITLHTHTHQFLAKIMQEVYSLSFHIGRNSDKGHSQGYAQLRHMSRNGGGLEYMRRDMLWLLEMGWYHRHQGVWTNQAAKRHGSCWSTQTREALLQTLVDGESSALQTS